jgi:hypothetical protein
MRLLSMVTQSGVFCAKVQMIFPSATGYRIPSTHGILRHIVTLHPFKYCRAITTSSSPEEVRS